MTLARFVIGGAWRSSGSTDISPAGRQFESRIWPTGPLFPATAEKHYTLGLSYRFTTSSELKVALMLAPESKVTNGQGVVVTHKQTNAQLMYSYRF